METTTRQGSVAKAARAAAYAHVAALTVQLGMALLFIAGLTDGIEMHRVNGYVVLAFGLLQLAVLGAARFRGLGDLFTVFAILTVVLEVAQLWVGRSGDLTLHVTLAMLIWGMAVALLVRTIDPAKTAIGTRSPE